MRGSTDELVFEVFGSEDGYFDEEELARDDAGVGVVEDGPHGDLCVTASREEGKDETGNGRTRSSS